MTLEVLAIWGQAAPQCHAEEARDIKFKFIFYEVIIARTETHIKEKFIFTPGRMFCEAQTMAPDKLMIHLDMRQTEIGRHQHWWYVNIHMSCLIIYQWRIQSQWRIYWCVFKIGQIGHLSSLYRGWPVWPLHHGPVPGAGGGERGAQAAGAGALVAVAQITETKAWE